MTHSYSVWETARIARLPGAQLQVQVAPKKVGVRIRNAARRMIESGVLVGSLRSQSRALAVALNQAYKLGLLASYGAYVPAEVLRGVAPQALQAFAPQLIAHAAALALEGHRHKAAAVHKTALAFQTGHLTADYYVIDDTGAQLTAHLVGACDEAQRLRRAQVIEQLGGSDPIPIIH